jgi:hypothetical protein
MGVVDSDSYGDRSLSLCGAAVGSTVLPCGCAFLIEPNENAKHPMGRSKEMGKPVEDLTFDELRREQVRCRTLAKIFPPKTQKSVLKRLLKIEERLKNESMNDS